jgi:hypothetical protein
VLLLHTQKFIVEDNFEGVKYLTVRNKNQRDPVDLLLKEFRRESG